MPLQLLFTDWGQPAVLRNIHSTYDPVTGQVQQTETVFHLTVVPGAATQNQRSTTAAVVVEQTATFLVQSSILPTAITLENSRLEVAGQQFTIMSLEQSPLSDLTILHCL